MRIKIGNDYLDYDQVVLASHADQSLKMLDKPTEEEKRILKQNRIEQDIDRILDKITMEGFDSLSKEEHERLYNGSRTLSQNKKKD